MMSRKAVLLAVLCGVVALAALAPAQGAKVTDDEKEIETVIGCSGGGARAAIGCLTALMWLEDINDLSGVTSINGVSGGSWGTTMFMMGKHGEAFLDTILDGMAEENAKRAKKAKGKKFEEKKWGETPNFSRWDSLRGKRKKVFKNWRRDTIANIFGDRPLQKPFTEVDVNSRKFPVCSFWSNGKDVKKPTQTCKWCSNTKTAECWTTDGKATRSDLDMSKPFTIEKEKHRGGLNAADMMAITSSAWTLASGAIKASADGNDMLLSDAGCDCNLPFDPKWLEAPAEGKKKTILQFDFSNDKNWYGKTLVGDSLDRCIEKWNKRYNLKMTKDAVLKRSTRINPDGTLASKEERAANKKSAKEGTHEVVSKFADLSLNDPKYKDIRIIWIFLRDLISPTDMLKKMQTIEGGVDYGLPRPYSAQDIGEIQAGFRKYLSDHVQHFLKGAMSTDFSTVGIANLFNE